MEKQRRILEDICKMFCRLVKSRDGGDQRGQAAAETSSGILCYGDGHALLELWRLHDFDIVTCVQALENLERRISRRGEVRRLAEKARMYINGLGGTVMEES